MNIWTLRVASDTTEYVVSEFQAMTLAAAQLRNPSVCFSCARDLVPALELTPINDDGDVVSAENYVDRDFGIWGRCAVFSRRAMSLFVEIDVPEHDFVGVKHAYGIPKLAYLPSRIGDLIEEASLVGMYQIPATPPIPFHLLKARPRLATMVIPSLFLNFAPGHMQHLGVFFVSENMVTRWLANGYSGAQFACLGDDYLSMM